MLKPVFMSITSCSQHDNKGHKFTRHQWQQANAKVVVCEIQAHLKVSFSFVFILSFGILTATLQGVSCLAGSAAHKNYVVMRDLLAQ